jgi:hypothetical protein
MLGNRFASHVPKANSLLPLGLLFVLIVLLEDFPLLLKLLLVVFALLVVLQHLLGFQNVRIVRLDILAIYQVQHRAGNVQLDPDRTQQSRAHVLVVQ